MNDELKTSEELDPEIPAFLRKKIVQNNTKVNIEHEEVDAEVREGSITDELVGLDRDVDMLEKLVVSLDSILSPIHNNIESEPFNRKETTEPPTEIGAKIRKIREKVYGLQNSVKRTAERIDL